MFRGLDSQNAIPPGKMFFRGRLVDIPTPQYNWGQIVAVLALMVLGAAAVAPSFLLASFDSNVGYLVYSTVFPVVVCVPLLCLCAKAYFNFNDSERKTYQSMIFFWFICIYPTCIAGGWYFNIYAKVLPSKIGVVPFSDISSAPQTIISVTNASNYRVFYEQSVAYRYTVRSQRTNVDKYLFIAPIAPIGTSMSMGSPVSVPGWAITSQMDSGSDQTPVVNAFSQPQNVWKQDSSNVDGAVALALSSLRLNQAPNAPAVMIFDLDQYRADAFTKMVCATVIPGGIFVIVWIFSARKILSS